MVKLNIDENPEIAQQMRIQSIPAVYAFKDGRPVDGFVGAQPEIQVKQFVQRLGGDADGPSPAEEAMVMANEAAQTGDHASAAAIYSEHLQPDSHTHEALHARERATSYQPGPRNELAIREIVAIFPLTGVLLLPRARLPLNVVDLRYLGMTGDALGGERRIGMVEPSGRQDDNRGGGGPNPPV